MARSEQSSSVKYIFVTGGVVSSLGKGLAAASIGCLLEGHGYRIKVVETAYTSASVDTPEDLERVRRMAADGLLP